ncbi:amino acid ABC transporter permease [Campylobacter sp. MIT 21-1685]|uniref:amino acid ABC transporter permease n=1 Tax=unclassified Campylobacter TaxID=2593542 RepID=UPI00224AFA80|nr:MULTISPECIES: amino acid ABC transporter permease [unclassified Campylobacter]MCX2682830.1 amino acid ABC transporter permease [Campylobacter sp. MIT 21-1684]MCX2751024.1 amino acid ABC transporter permease [Campylobacter sp. MIT 21-1682]MCX2807311.1 amino acid ABC transporter permease [Campylobacter sp. MIT 21-1685]
MNESVGFVEYLRQLLIFLGIYDENSINPFALWKFLDALQDWKAFLQGFLYTLEVSFFALAIAIIFGTIGGIMATSKIKIIKAYTRTYVEVFQNTPLVIQIFFLYFGLPRLGVNLDIYTIGVLGIGAYHGAYISEVVRGGILAVPRGQFEASAAQGFTYVQQMRYIIIPQTIKIILPPMTNQMVNLIKNTSVLLIIGGVELMGTADSYAAEYGNYAPSYIFAAILYFIICYPLAYFAKFYEEKLKKTHLLR